MNNNTTTTKVGVTFMDLLLLTNIILKLCGVISWSWAVVLWPLWAGIGLILILIILFIILSLIS